MDVVEVAGPIGTLFCPGGVLPPPFWHWSTAVPLTLVCTTTSALPSPASEAVQVTVALGGDVVVIVQVGSPPFLKCGLAARDVCAPTSTSPSASTKMVASRRIRVLLPPEARVPR